jgi:hypothetical protein
MDTPRKLTSDMPSRSPSAIDDFDAGMLVGVLVGEGHFGGDGRQPQVTLRMHTDHRSLFEWLLARFPESRLYGPYDHAGRRYYQWMARGRFLREQLLPILHERLRPEHSGRVWERFVAMCDTYGLGRPPLGALSPHPTDEPAAGVGERIPG